jgi:hypothetical protein
MKDKLYVFLKKRPNLFMFLVIATPVFGVTGTVTKNELLTQTAAVVMGLLCITAVLFDIESSRRSYAKARQRLQDQRDSASPDWDGLVRLRRDIEPRLRLLLGRMAQDQQEVNDLRYRCELSSRLAESDQAADS